MTQALIFFLVAIAALGFLAGIVAAGYFSLKYEPKKMPEFLAQLVTTTNGILATNLGAVIGLAKAGVADFAHVTLSVPTWLGSPLVSDATQLQVGAAWFYVIGLVVALGIWASMMFSQDPERVVPTLPELA